MYQERNDRVITLRETRGRTRTFDLVPGRNAFTHTTRAVDAAVHVLVWDSRTLPNTQGPGVRDSWMRVTAQ